MKRTLLGASLFLLAVAAGPCGDKTSPDLLTGEGTVTQGVGPECPDRWAVRTANGDLLWPVENAAFQKKDLKVRFTARPKMGEMSICMAGTIVEFVTMEER